MQFKGNGEECEYTVFMHSFSSSKKYLKLAKYTRPDFDDHGKNEGFDGGF